MVDVGEDGGENLKQRETYGTSSMGSMKERDVIDDSQETSAV